MYLKIRDIKQLINLEISRKRFWGAAQQTQKQQTEFRGICWLKKNFSQAVCV